MRAGVAACAGGARGVESAPCRVSRRITENWRWTRPSELVFGRCRSSVIVSDVIDYYGVAVAIAVTSAGVRDLRSTRMTLTLHVLLARRWE
jgi:hypothetical protein